MKNNQHTQNRLQEIKISALSILERVGGSDPTDVKSAMQEYIPLVDRFYEINEEIIAPDQYTAAKEDFEYFMRLIELAIAYIAAENKKSTDH